jgi:hypothetical protein
MIAAIVAQAGVRSIARMRACLVSGRVEAFGDECADRERGLDLLVVRAAERVEILDFDFDLDFVGSPLGLSTRRPSSFRASLNQPSISTGQPAGAAFQQPI